MGSTRPYFGRPDGQPPKLGVPLPPMSSLMTFVDRGEFGSAPPLSVQSTAAGLRFGSLGSVRALLQASAHRTAASPGHVDLTGARLPSRDGAELVTAATVLFARRAAAAAATAVAGLSLREPDELLETKEYRTAPAVRIPIERCLAVCLYGELFDSTPAVRPGDLISDVLLRATPGWCGSMSPEIESELDLVTKKSHGDYDMSQMHLLQIAYRYYDELTPEAREHLVTNLLAKGRIRRVNLPDTLTSGQTPNDWGRAGVALAGTKRIGETENHILMIATVRYLTNQLLYQRQPAPRFDNRRNGGSDFPSGMIHLLSLLRSMLTSDFSEYNAKPYQHVTRAALLNLCSYSYDHEVRLAARMVLDYLSARFATSSCDLRRSVPFRRINEPKHRGALLPGGFMGSNLLHYGNGADPTVESFAQQSGQLRALHSPTQMNPHAHAVRSGGGLMIREACSSYRLPPSIHELFVNDQHRRFFQRLHRTPLEPVDLTGRNCEGLEIYASSMSYLISAGGRPSTHAIDPLILGMEPPDQDKQLGVAVTTSFIPVTGTATGVAENASDVIQLSCFGETMDSVMNYGVAPDFACGHQLHLPASYVGERERGFLFINQKLKGSQAGPGFFLAILQDGGFALLEAFDCWRRPEKSFDQFKADVLRRNPSRRLRSNEEAVYTTDNGNRLRFVIWNQGERHGVRCGAEILHIDYGHGAPADTLEEAGNDSTPFLSGTVMRSAGDGLVEVKNPGLGNTIVLDLRDMQRPRRVAENGEVEHAGPNSEVWVDPDWVGPTEGDFFRPFTSLAAALHAVADGGVIRIVPGTVKERRITSAGKKVTLTAQIGGVRLTGA